MTTYEDIGVPTIINADARWTGLGGSLMHPEVLDAMNAAAGHYVDINVLQRTVGARIAQLTHNEDAYVSANATAGVAISVLACLTRGDTKLIARLPDVSGAPHEVIVHSGHRIPFDQAIAVGCGRLVQIGNAYHTTEIDLEAAINPKTAAVFYVAGNHVQGALSMDTTVEIAHRHNLPVIVDAAAQLPPRSNLWHFSSEVGADLVVFSGGKDLAGPQASGLVVGRSEFIEACRVVGPPSPNWPRVMKTGKEEIMGLLRAVERYVERDEAAYLTQLDAVVADWLKELEDVPGVTARRLVPSLDGQPTPRALLTLDANTVGMSGAQLAKRLLDQQPSIRIGSLNEESVYLNPETLGDGEAELVIKSVKRALTAGGSTHD
jgi:L-seryl-tRNA(Ser) seleniumtransferase